MSVQRTSLYGRASLFAIGEACALGIAVAAVPALARLMSPAEFGAFQIATAVIGIAQLLGGMSLQSAVLRYGSGAQSETTVRAYVTVAIAGALVGGSAIASALYAAPWNQLIGIDDRVLSGALIASVAAAIPLFGLRVVVQTLARARARPVAFATCVVVGQGGGAVLGALLVWRTGAEATAAVLGAAGGNGLAALLGVVLQVRDCVPVVPSWAVVRRALRYSAPLAVWGIGAWAAAFTDRVVVGWLEGLPAAGVYALASKATLGIALVGQGLESAFLPAIFASGRERRAEVPKLQQASVAALVMALIATVLLAPILMVVLGGARYEAHWPLVLPLAAAVSLKAFLKLNGAPVLLAEKTTLISTAVLAAGCLNLIATPTLTMLLGAYGAAIATLLSWLVANIMIGRASVTHARTWASFRFVGASLFTIGMSVALSVAVDMLALARGASLVLRLGLCAALLPLAYRIVPSRTTPES